MSDLVRAVVVDTGCAHHGMDVLVDAEPDVLEHHVGMREVDDHLTARISKREQPLPATNGGHQIHVRRRIDGLADLGTHPTARADHSDPKNLIRHGDAAFLVWVKPARVV